MRAYIALAVALAAPGLALAQPRISYDYFHIGAIRAEVDALGLDADADGIELEGSFEVGEYVFLFGAFGSFEIDDVPDADVELRIFGAGAHYDLGDTLSVFGALGYSEGDLEAGNVTADDDGLYVRAGVRYMPLRRLEVRGGFERSDFDDLGDDVALFAGGNWYVTDVVALDFGYRRYDDLSLASLGLRFFFGNEVPRGRRRY